MEEEMVKKNQLFLWKDTWDYLEQQEFATEKDVKYVNELVKHLNSSLDKVKHQSLLTILSRGRGVQRECYTLVCHKIKTVHYINFICFISKF